MDITLDELLKKYEEQLKKCPVSLENDTVSKGKDIEHEIYNINEVIIQQEENQKLRLRDKLTKTVTKFIWIQLIFFNIVVVFIVLSATSNIAIFKVVDNDLATLLFDFLKYYISATIVELLGMLVFILHYVFSKYSRIGRIIKKKKVRPEEE
ncbi:MAG: hypothetical protein K2N15_11265 [Lachnospiraceae bacterium]|nr:hypothetical protein [Lachnospiraceae bacterium]